MATDTFQPGDAGKEVSIDILVMADSGYKFANPVIVKADGSSKETTVSFGENTPLIACKVFFKVQGDETAVTEYPLWIGGVQVTSKNQDDVLNDGKVKFEVKNGENILTLNGATITGYHAEGDESACIFVTDYDLDLKINLIGKNNVGSYAAKYGISQFKGKLTLTGSGSLTIDEYPTYAAIFAADLSIEKTSIDLNGWFYGLITKNSITISDSNVKTRSESSLGTGIESMTGNIEILDSTVNAGGGLFGIHTANATKVRIAGNGTVTAVAIDDEKGRAILANDIELDGVEITFPENGYVGSCEYNGQARKTIYNSENNIYRIAVIKLVSLSYSVVSGAEGTYTLNSGNDYVLAVKRSTRDEICIDHFESVELDRQPLTKDTDYTAVKGSTIVTLKAEALNKLSEREHTVTVNFDDGKAETSLTVKAAPDPTPTPDPTPVTPYQIPKTGVE
jgi:lipopolysaccharide export system protein LptA